MNIKLYYKQGIEFSMRDFISKIIKKYLEYLVTEENDASPQEITVIQNVMMDFEKWLYQTTKS